MANAVSAQEFNFDRPRSPQVEFNVKLSIDTLTTSAVNVADLLDALASSSDWKERGLDLDDVVYGVAHCDGTTEGAKYEPRYDHVNQKLHLVKTDGSGLANGSITAVDVWLNLKFKS